MADKCKGEPLRRQAAERTLEVPLYSNAAGVAHVGAAECCLAQLPLSRAPVVMSKVPEQPSDGVHAFLRHQNLPTADSCMFSALSCAAVLPATAGDRCIQSWTCQSAADRATALEAGRCLVDHARAPELFGYLVHDQTK